MKEKISIINTTKEFIFKSKSQKNKFIYREIFVFTIYIIQLKKNIKPLTII